MGKIIQFTPNIKPENHFMTCACGGGNCLMPVGRLESGQALIVGLQCPDCDTFLDVANGFVVAEDE